MASVLAATPRANGLAGFAITFTPVREVMRSRKAKAPATAGAGVDGIKSAVSGSQLSVLFEHSAAIAADAPAMCGQRSAATKQTFPSHAARMVTHLGCRRFAWRQFSEIDCTGARGPNTSKHASGDDHFHAETGPSIFDLKAPAYPELETKATLFVRRTNARIGITFRNNLTHETRHKSQRSQYLAAIGSSSAGNSEITVWPLSVTTTSSSMRAAE